jgi:magnesium-transporting ATPase (P-type)
MAQDPIDTAREKDATLRGKFRSAEDRVAAGKARIEEPYGADLLLSALIASLWKFDPRVQVRNPVMFVVWLGALVTALLTIYPGLFGPSSASAAYNGVVTVILLLTVWFANFAEALAEGRGKAKAASLRRTKTELMARRVLAAGEIGQVPATDLRKGDVVRVEKGELIPTDGEVIEGVAYVNESAITGESAPVLKEPGTDVFSSVTAGTTLISDSLLVRVTANPGESFLDRMIHLVEGAKRQKTPNEMALTVLLAILTLIFLIAVAAMAPVAVYLQARINTADLIALLVTLIPTTIGALLSPSASPASIAPSASISSPCPARLSRLQATYTHCCSTRPARSPWATGGQPSSLRSRAAVPTSWSRPPTSRLTSTRHRRVAPLSLSPKDRVPNAARCRKARTASTSRPRRR